MAKKEATGCRALRAMYLFFRRHSNTTQSDKRGERSRNSNGKLRIGDSTVCMELSVQRKIEHPPNAAPRYESLGVMYDDQTRRITDVLPDSAADRAGLCPFDTIVEINGEPLPHGVPLRAAIQFARSPCFRIERPHSSMHADIALSMGDDPQWISVVLAVLTGDADAVLNGAHALASNGESITERRLTARDVAAVSLAMRAFTGQPMEALLPVGCLLVECALESSHPQIVQMLLSGDGCFSEGVKIRGSSGRLSPAASGCRRGIAAHHAAASSSSAA